MADRAVEPTVGTTVLLLGLVGLYGVASALGDGGSVAQLVTITKALGGILALLLSGGVLYVFSDR